MDEIQKAVIFNARKNEKENASIKAKISADYEENTKEHKELSDRIVDVDNRVDDVEQAVQDIELLEPQKGEKGDKGDSIKGDNGYTPVKGKDYFDGKDGYTPVKGVDYFDGIDAEPVDEELIIKELTKKIPEPIKGEKGDKPDHKWNGTKLAFEKPDGTLGKFVDLRGKSGASGSFLQGSSGKMIEVQSDGVNVIDSLKSVNFAEGLKVTDNGNGYVTVDADGSEIPFYWSRTGTTLTTKTAGDDVVIDNNIYTDGYYFNDDTDTGFCLYYNGSFGIKTAGSLRMAVTSALITVPPEIRTNNATVAMKLRSRVYDSASAVAFTMDSDYTLSTNGSKHTSFTNNNSEIAYIDYTGGAYFGGCVGIGGVDSSYKLYVNGSIKAEERMIRSKSVYTGTDTTDTVYLHICDSATAFTLTVTDGTQDGEEMKIVNRGAGAVTLSGKFNSVTTVTTLYSGESMVFNWDVTDDNWE